jgi:hypothetical protein
MEILVPSSVACLNISIGMFRPLAVARRGLMLVAVSDARIIEVLGGLECCFWSGRTTATHPPFAVMLIMTKRFKLGHYLLCTSFKLRQGLLVKHRDTFELWRWTRLALGPAGMLPGWRTLLQGEVRRTALAGLDAWCSKTTGA